MSQLRRIRTITVTAVAILLTALTSTTASAASTDRTPPTPARVNYAQGYYCLTLIMGAMRSTDNVTPPSQLRYEVFADGTFIGLLSDRGADSGVWGVLALPHTGPNTVAVQTVDAAGNRSAFSNSTVVTGYYTPGSGCTPGHI
jgi:hypothetical protein